MNNYRGWQLEISFRRQIVFSKQGEPSFFASDTQGKIRDGDLTWRERLFAVVQKKIDLHLSGGLNKSAYIAEATAASIIQYNLNCHKLLLEEENV